MLQHEKFRDFFSGIDPSLEIFKQTQFAYLCLDHQLVILPSTLGMDGSYFALDFSEFAAHCTLVLSNNIDGLGGGG